MDKDDTTNKSSEAGKQDVPDVHAFHDSFTRDFLQSTEETEEGFYAFLSKTEKYKMDFPAGGVIDDQTYSVKDDVHEEVPISIEDDTGFGMDVFYYSNHTKERLNDDLDRFKKRLGYDGDFDQVEEKDRTLYYARIEDDALRTYAGYVLNEKGTGGIELTYSIDCQDEKAEECEKNKQRDKERAMNWMKSVQFMDEDGGHDNG